MQPMIVITRPKAQADSFAQDLRGVFGAELPVLIAPLMRIDPITPADVGQPDHVIFTSVNGVAQAGRFDLGGATAWCVGDQTAAAASALGLTVRNAKGTSADLIAMIRAARPVGQIVHLRGAHATGNIAKALTEAGLPCRSVVVYAQVDTDPPPDLLLALKSDRPLIIPVFSPRSAELLPATRPVCAPVTLIAMSEAVARAASDVPVAEVITAKFPDKISMITATLEVYSALYPIKTP